MEKKEKPAKKKVATTLKPTVEKPAVQVKLGSFVLRIDKQEDYHRLEHGVFDEMDLTEKEVKELNAVLNEAVKHL